jgi:hypothetical protein
MGFFTNLLIVILIFFVVTSFFGKSDFWKLTRKNPQAAWDFFSSHSEWYFENKPIGVDVVGPFRIVNPYTGQLVKIYCDSSRIEASQNEFMKLYSTK